MLIVFVCWRGTQKLIDSRPSHFVAWKLHAPGSGSLFTRLLAPLPGSLSPSGAILFPFTLNVLAHCTMVRLVEDFDGVLSPSSTRCCALTPKQERTTSQHLQPPLSSVQRQIFFVL